MRHACDRQAKPGLSGSERQRSDTQPLHLARFGGAGHRRIGDAPADQAGQTPGELIGLGSEGTSRHLPKRTSSVSTSPQMSHRSRNDGSWDWAEQSQRGARSETSG